MIQSTIDYVADMYDHAQASDSWWRRSFFQSYAFGAVDCTARQLSAEDAKILYDIWEQIWVPLFEQLLDEVDEGA